MSKINPKKSKKILTILFAFIMIAAGCVHFIRPANYFAFIPNGLPKLAIVHFSGVLEIVVGICALIPHLNRLGTLGILILMISFLPLHIVDVFKDQPAIGSHLLAYIRLPFQFIFIAWAWFIYKRD